ncbi:unnamed protein product [Caenorhabditis auriculariae]|uniref:Protein kinase domain-containing protein n=1 Tax=Caenorhabditis auriculariae TaxID=2777116 RepID=A0A8S1HUZ9_9PELO|nr:unnamed protein product [Caenorhabditis auriculariae]
MQIVRLSWRSSYMHVVHGNGGRSRAGDEPRLPESAEHCLSMIVSVCSPNAPGAGPPKTSGQSRQIMPRLFILSAILIPYISTFSLVQDTKGSGCVELLCPAAAIDFGIKKLVNEDTWASETCSTCKQCTDNGYSVCLRVQDSRAARIEGGCSCSHAVPSNCHGDVRQTVHPANITMRLYTVCYSSVLQTPAKPIAVNENFTVTVTVEPFWAEAYWQPLNVTNLTLHYEYVTKNPEHCEGDLTTSSTGVHTCKASHPVNLDEAEAVEPENGDYEHSENYDDVLPEIQFDRVAFRGVKMVRFYYTASVKRTRQLSASSPHSSGQQIHDTTTVITSEPLDFDLKPEVYGNGVRPGKDDQPVAAKPVTTSEDDATPVPEAEEEEDEGVSEEKGGTDFFRDDGPAEADSGEQEKKEKEEEEETEDSAVEVNLADVKPTKLEVNTKKPTDKSPIELSEPIDDAKASEEVEATTEAKEEEEEDEEADEVADKDEDVEKEKEEDHLEDGEKDEEEASEEKEGEEATTESAGEEEEDKEKDDEDEDDVTSSTVSEDETTAGEDDEETTDESEEGSGDEEDEDLSFLEKFVRRSDFPRVRLVFLITLVAFITFLLLVCLVRHRKNFCGKAETKTSNGYRYSSASGTVRGTEMKPLTPKTNEKRVSADEIALINQSDVETERTALRELVRTATSFNPSKIEMGMSVGVGQFGSIHRAIFNSFNGSVHDVNIYLLKDVYHQSAAQLSALTSQLRMNVLSGTHHNVVTLRAVAQNSGDLLLMWEPLAQPTLQGVLRESRCARFGPDAFKSASFLSAERLVAMAIGCCNGVEHLTKRGVMHPHLATANVLVAERGVVKISGFGLADHQALNASTEPKPLPLRWQSPEHFKTDSTVDERSTVWSVGVLLWEIFSLGGTPFLSIRQAQQFVDSMRDGSATLDPIPYCQPAITQLLSATTSHSADARPDLRTIIRRLECVSADAKAHIDLSLHDAFPYVPISSQLEHQTENSTTDRTTYLIPINPPTNFWVNLFLRPCFLFEASPYAPRMLFLQPKRALGTDEKSWRLEMRIGGAGCKRRTVNGSRWQRRLSAAGDLSVPDDT